VVQPKEVWNKIYEREGASYHTPVETLTRFIPLLKREKCERVLDVGCGVGKHMLVLAREGLEVYGVDLSDKAIQIARDLFKREGFQAGFVQLDIYEEKFPFPDAFFDAVISFNVLPHNRLTKIRKAIAEIARVLRRGGLLIVTLRKRIPRSRMHRSKFLDKRTYVQLEGRETGIVHYLFTKKIIHREFGKFFKIESIEVIPDKWWPKAYYLVVGKRL